MLVARKSTGKENGMHGTWAQQTIAGKTVDLYDLSSPIRPRFAILFLHATGLDTLVNKPAFTKLFDELRIACACPHGQRSWWADRICREFDDKMTAEQFLLQHIAPFMMEHWHLDERSIGLLGVSMGGQGALRLAFKHAKFFTVAAGIAPAIDYHEWHGKGYSIDEMYNSKEQCRQDTVTLHVRSYGAPPHIFFCVDPDDHDWYRGNDRLHEKLRALGIEHTCDLTTRAGGHSWDYYNAMADRAVRFVHAGLEQESRRLL
jgi:S-formylglutathione hydrolase